MGMDPREISEASPNARPLDSATVRWTHGGKTFTAAVKTLDRDDATLDIESPAAFFLGRTVWLLEGSAESPCAVIGCEGIDGGHKVTLRYLHAGRRREDRDYTLGTGRADWRRSDGVHDSVVAAVSNLSDGGMQLLSRRPIEQGAFVRLKGEQFECQGFVRYCTAGEDGDFLIGLQFAQTPYERRSLDYED